MYLGRCGTRFFFSTITLKQFSISPLSTTAFHDNGSGVPEAFQEHREPKSIIGIHVEKGIEHHWA